MFTGISWGSYITIFALLSVCWYVYVILRYYRTEISNVLKRKSNITAPAVRQESDNFFIEAQEEMTPAGSFNEWQDTTREDVEHLMARVNEVVIQATRNTFDKKEFMGYLGLVLKEFTYLQNSPHRTAINEFIESACHAKGLLISEEETDQLW